MKTCVIIGGGIGGLVSGALLAKEGYKVTVLEKNAIIGGGLQTFKRHGVSFPTGMHIFGGFQEGGNLRKLFEYLGVMDKIALRRMDEEASDVVTLIDSGTTYRLPQGKERFEAYLSSMFPAEKEQIKAYIDKLFELSEEENLFHLRETPADHTSHSEDFMGSVERLRNQYITNPKLKALLGYLGPLFGSAEPTTPAYIHALLSTLHINGAYQFVGESQQLAKALEKVIENAGGLVIANEEVVRIEVENHQVIGVLTSKGHRYQADNYISDVHPDVLLRIIDDGAFPTAFKNRVSEIPETFSSFKVFIKFKEKAFPYLNQAHFVIDNSLNVKEINQDNWPREWMFVSPPVENQGDFAQTMVIISEMDFSWVKPWENTRTGHRGEAYENWKRAMTDKVLNCMERLYPDFRDRIEFVFASSPLTIRDLYGNKEGSNYGFQKDSRNLMLSQMSVFTKVKNLFLTGQNVNIHGLCGVSLTAIETAEALVGRNAIVRKINKFWINHS
jgi:all-trans-retinol 13,14-reductase